MRPEIVDYPSRAALVDGLAGIVAGRLRSLAAERGRAALAVPGGTTPGPMLERLGEADLPWERIAVTLTDERWVPVSSERSNQRLLAGTLFRGRAAAAEFVPLHAGTPEPEQGIDAVNASLARIALPLDIAVLGMGADMHTASLFPGAVGLERALAPDAPAAVAIRAPGAEAARVTLSARVLAAAGERHVLIAGAEKRAALARALEIGDRRLAPILAVLPGATVHHAD